MCPPADKKSPVIEGSVGLGLSGSQRPTACTWNPWKPGGRPVTRTSTCVPPSTSVMVATPTSAPSGSTSRAVSSPAPAPADAESAAATPSPDDPDCPTSVLAQPPRTTVSAHADRTEGTTGRRIWVLLVSAGRGSPSGSYGAALPGQAPPPRPPPTPACREDTPGRAQEDGDPQGRPSPAGLGEVERGEQRSGGVADVGVREGRAQAGQQPGPGRADAADRHPEPGADLLVAQRRGGDEQAEQLLGVLGEGPHRGAG